MLDWDLYEFDNKHARTRYTEFVFFNSVESVGQVVHSSAFEV
jgi:hypothetical protein